jgi:hypothetical protein
MKLFNNAIDFLVKIKDPNGDIRRELAEKEAEAELIKTETGAKNHIICNGKPFPIDWEKVKTFDDEGAFSLPNNCYKTAKNERNPSMFVCHWDVCLSSKSCFNVLKKRKLSVHFLIDNDGTIHQIMDTNDIGYHAGNRRVNNVSLGVEITNAYYPKYQPIYESRGFGARPVWDDSEVHGRTLEPHLGFYPVQIEALGKLMKAVSERYNIPLQTPENNGIITTVDKRVSSAKYNGFVNHYHITSRKIDCAGLNLKEIIENNK